MNTEKAHGRFSILTMKAHYFPWIGGAELFAKNVAEYMVTQGHRVTVITGLWAQPDVYRAGWNQEYEMINGVEVYRVKMNNIRYVKTLSAIYPLYKKALSIHLRQHFDLIHAHIFPDMVSGALLKLKTKLPYLITVQGGDLADYKETTGAFFGVMRPLISWSLKHADLVQGVSNHTAERALKLGAKSTTVIPNGVDLNIFHPTNQKSALRKKYGFSDEDKIIVSASRLTPKNGIDFLIKTTLELAKSIPKLKLLVIGDGEQRKDIESLIKKTNLQDMVKLLGYLPHNELPAYLQLSDVFCRPSRDEGFGISFIEAMACGIPVIGTKVGGIPDIITDGYNGFMIKSGDLQALGERIKLCLNQQKLRETLSQNALKVVKEKFNWEEILKKMEGIYSGLVSN